jgi:hypothetical protein
MEIKYQGHSRRTETAMALWVQIATEYNARMTPEQIRHRHINPRTGKPYSRGYIYWVLDRIKTIPAKTLGVPQNKFDGAPIL